jgi:hypothetical protein
MEYSISLRLDLKTISNAYEVENLIYDIGNNCNATNIYSDFELNGTNNYIKNNFKMVIIELDNKKSLLNLLEIIKSLNKIEIEYIYCNNEIIYGDKKYLNNLELNQNKNLLIDKINENKKNYKDIYKLIKN